MIARENASRLAVCGLYRPREGLANICASHQQRTEWLRAAVLALGGTPASALPPELREFVEQRLLPEQRHTHATLTQVTSRL